MPRKTRILSLLAQIHDGLERFIDQANKHETLDLRSITMTETVQSAAQYLSEDGLTADATRLQSAANHLVDKVIGVFLHRVARNLPPTRQAAYVMSYRLPPLVEDDPESRDDRLRSILGAAVQLRDHTAELISDTKLGDSQPLLNGPTKSAEMQGVAAINDQDDFLVSIQDLRHIAFSRPPSTTIRDHLKRGGVTQAKVVGRGKHMYRYSEVVTVWSADSLREPLPSEEEAKQRLRTATQVTSS